jgi:hypothetical protein
MADGKWQMANGRWQMADGKWQRGDGRNGRNGSYDAWANMTADSLALADAVILEWPRHRSRE